MSGIRRFMVFFSLLLIFSGCQDRMVPSGYIPMIKDVPDEAFGSWIQVNTTKDPISGLSFRIWGELISVGPDTACILTGTDLIKLHRNNITYAKLYLFIPGRESVIGIIALIPTLSAAIFNSEWGSGFFVLGWPLMATTFIQTASRGNETLLYPSKATWNELSKYSRYPAGLPSGISKEKLHLKNLKAA